MEVALLHTYGNPLQKKQRLVRSSEERLLYFTETLSCDIAVVALWKDDCKVPRACVLPQAKLSTAGWWRDDGTMADYCLCGMYASAGVCFCW